LMRELVIRLGWDIERAWVRASRVWAWVRGRTLS
jgi:hypothetical protein